MANKIVVNIPDTVITENGTTTSIVVPSSPNEVGYVLWVQVKDRLGGTASASAQISTSADGPWINWIIGLGQVENGQAIYFPGGFDLEGFEVGSLLYFRLSATVSGIVENGLTLNAYLCAREVKNG